MIASISPYDQSINHCYYLIIIIIIITSNSPPEDLAWSPEMVRTSAWVCVHALTKELQILHCKQTFKMTCYVMCDDEASVTSSYYH